MINTHVIVLANALVDIIDDSRANSYDSWLEIGNILYTTGRGDYKMLDVWKRFSWRSTKYKPDICIELWQNMQCGDKTINTLMYYARADNPFAFAAVKETHMKI